MNSDRFLNVSVKELFNIIKELLNVIHFSTFESSDSYFVIEDDDCSQVYIPLFTKEILMKYDTSRLKRNCNSYRGFFLIYFDEFYLRIFFDQRNKPFYNNFAKFVLWWVEANQNDFVLLYGFSEPLSNKNQINIAVLREKHWETTYLSTDFL